ncbi:hypothetical protein [Streptomyces sp. NPDC048623]|uniref:hypothetical protein n=1 Tax=Streptomyces sp. NPDC048623 TaxID=3155761 RepID=UPI00343F60BF
MTLPHKSMAVAGALALASFLATGCSSESTTPPSAPSPSATGKPTATPSPSGEDEKAQGSRAKAVLETISPDDPKFVESGLERVPDGVHTRSSLKKGKAYKVSVACVGTGTVNLVIDGKPSQSISCDGTSASQRVQNSPTELPIDITATPGATGMVAWQVTAV